MGARFTTIENQVTWYASWGEDGQAGANGIVAIYYGNQECACKRRIFEKRSE